MNDDQHQRAALRGRIERLFELHVYDSHPLVTKLITDGPDLPEMLELGDLDLLRLADLTIGDELQRLRRGAPIPARQVPVGGWFSVPMQDGGRYVFQRVPEPPDAAARGTCAQATEVLLEFSNPPSIWVRRYFEGRMTTSPYPLAEAALVIYPLSG